jgi:hypothetical protein
MAWIVVAITIALFLKPLLRGLFCKKSEMIVCEGLKNYFESLEAEDVKWWIEEEIFNREKLVKRIFFNLKGFKVLTDTEFEKLKNVKPGNKCIVNTHSYEILANPQYIEDFQYVPVKSRRENDER